MASEPSLTSAKYKEYSLSFKAIAKDILQQLDRKIDAPASACPRLQDHEHLGSTRLTDIRTRFLLWSGNLGVMHGPGDPRALDTRLFSAHDVANRVRQVLHDLQDLLNQCEPPPT